MESLGIQILARLRAGIPVDPVSLARLPPDDPHADIVRLMIGANGRAVEIFEAAIEGRPDRDQVVLRMAAVDVEKPLPSPRFALWTAEQIKRLPLPSWLIQDTIIDGSSVLLFGQSGSMKTFEALEIAACVASGSRWHDIRETRRGVVVYVAAEGSGGLGNRLTAWERQHPGADLGNLHFVPRPVNLLAEREVTLFLAETRAAQEQVDLVVLDTLARCMPGAEENGSRDMGLAVAGMDRIRETLGATVLAVHHTGKNGESERGHTSLRGAMDTLIKTEAEGQAVTISCVKQKDAEPFANRKVRLRAVEGTGSCVLEYSESESTAELTPGERDTLRVLTLFEEDGGAATTSWRKGTGLTDRTFYRHRKELLNRGHVEPVGQGLRKRYVLTEQGRNALAPQEKGR